MIKSKKNKPQLSHEEFEVSQAVAKRAAITRYPSPIKAKKNPMSKQEKIAFIADKFRDIMLALDLDLTDGSLARTPERVARMYIEEVFSGLDLNEFPRVSFIEDQYQHDERANMVLVKVKFHSFCEHHFVPMFGTAHVAYIPNGKLIGLSKIPRIVRFFARRPQVQERLGAQIADSLCTLMDTQDVAVSISAQHFCVIARGIEDENSHTITNVLRGAFDTHEALRNEFFEGVNRKYIQT
ncbi:GTP cyclohydrolase I FolE [Parachlamydia sp.]|uniref:GTP cyclohydrolase I FolE n=1 Tax=Parachlamydia sp. TaxID=2052048 RepID=UPI003D0C0D6A